MQQETRGGGSQRRSLVCWHPGKLKAGLPAVAPQTSSHQLEARLIFVQKVMFKLVNGFFGIIGLKHPSLRHVPRRPCFNTGKIISPQKKRHTHTKQKQKTQPFCDQIPILSLACLMAALGLQQGAVAGQSPGLRGDQNLPGALPLGGVVARTPHLPVAQLAVL